MSAAAADAATCDLPIRAVTVHPDGALVRRSGTATAHEGLVIVRRLPLLLDPSSVRVVVEGGTLGDVRVDLDVQGLDREAPVAPEQALRAAVDELRALDSRLSALGDERAGIADLAPELVDDADVPLPPAERLARWPATEQALGDWAAELDEQVRTLRREREALKEQVARLQAEVQQQSTEAWWRRWAPTRRAVLRVVADGEVHVEVSYRVPGATWSPAYTLDTDALLREGRLTLRALVVQRTGEDWGGVQLGLSTAPCARIVDLPELPALKLGTRQPPPAPAWRELPPGLDALFPGDLVVPPSPLGGVEPPEPRLEDVTIDTLEREEEATLEESGAAFDDDDEWTPLPPSELVDDPTPVLDVPQALAASAPARSASWFGGGAPPHAPAAAPQAAGAPRRRMARKPAPPEAPDQLESPTVDYGRLRLADWTRPPGRRGHLYPADDDELLAEAGLPRIARERLGACRARAAEQAHAATARPLPPHHVVPDGSGGADHCWTAAGTVDVPSDGRFHAVSVTTAPASLEVTYRAVPRHDPRAFRRLEATLQLDGPLLAGPVDVFIDGALELTTHWAGTPGRGHLRLGLGVEDRLTLARNVRYREESAGLFGGSRRLHTTVEVQVASSLPRPVKLELLERIPVAEDADSVQVDLAACTPTAETWEGDRDGPILEGGRRQWLELAPGGEARAVLSYTVTIANRDELVGGDRRG